MLLLLCGVPNGFAQSPPEPAAPQTAAETETAVAEKPTAGPEVDSPEFNSDVRPILSDHCFACHGPDEHERQGGLRLDTADGISMAIDAEHPAESLLVERIDSDDESIVMPPPEFNKPLTEGQKRTLRAWVAAGGRFEEHWAYRSPVKADLPRDSEHPIDHFIDQKIAAKGLSGNGPAGDATLLRRVCLDLTGLPPTREQIRRVAEGKLDYEKLVDELLASPAFGQHFGRYWLDLVRYADTHGLHLDNYREMWPYRDWVIDAFNDNKPFDQFIGEQLAGDLMPEATLEQKIASGFNRLNVTTSEGGSIYDEVFARNVIDRTDAFGTIFLGLTTQCAVCHDHKFDPISQKDYYSLFAFFNSLDGRALDGNKKDHPPVVRVPTREQRQQLSEFDRQLAETRTRMNGPIESVDQAQRQWEASLLEPAKSASDALIETLPPTAVASQANADVRIEADQCSVVSGENVADQDTHTIELKLPESLAESTWRTIELEVLPDPKTDRGGVSPNGNAVLTEIGFQTRSADGESDWTDLPIAAAAADQEQSGGDFAVSFAIDQKTDRAAGWAIAGHETTGGRRAWFSVPEIARRIAEGPQQLRVRLEYRSRYGKHQFYGVRFRLSDVPHDAQLVDPIEVGELHAVGPFPVESENPGFYRKFASEQAAFDAEQTFPYQGKTYQWKIRQDWTPVGVHDLPVDGESVAVNLLHQTLTSPKAQQVELLLGTSDGHVVLLGGKRLAESKHVGSIRPLHHTYTLDLKQGRNDLYIKTVSLSRPARFAYAYRSPAIALPETISELASRSPDQRSEQDNASLRQYYRKVQCDHPDWLAMKDMIRGIEAEKEKLRDSIATTLVWEELEEPREAKILVRGQYDQPGETVPRQVPGFLPPMDDSLPRDRLGLARWLISPENPLTARVAVNRFWQSIFGSGLVKTSEDFGSQGEPPSHPQLLDWLAVDFRESGWDVKRLVRLMVTSDAYRRDASVGDKQLRVDPENRLLARGPRHRLDAEVLRDQALALAGLLNTQAGGPSVKPPQPGGLWYAVGYTRSNTANFQADPEPVKQFRRSAYIFWKRTSAPPQMSTFDAPSRESCTARRERTNTPLQALVLMNEHQYVQASKHLAMRVLSECSSDDPADRSAWLMETVTARSPSADEVNELVSLYQTLRSHYGEHPQAAADLLSVDEVVAEGVQAAEHAAWMMIASTVLNLDEVVNK